MKIFDKEEFKKGFKKGQMLQIEHPRAIWIPLLIIAVIFLFVFSYSPANAYPSKSEVIAQYKTENYYTPSLSMRFNIPFVRYVSGGVNDCFNRYYTCAIYGNSIAPEILHDAINKVNPFFHISVVGIDENMYSFDASGEVYCRQPYTIIIAHTNGPYHGVSRGRGCVTIYIPDGYTPRIDSLSSLIMHECCHEIQTGGNIDSGYPLDKCISDYSRECAGWKTRVNVIRM